MKKLALLLTAIILLLSLTACAPAPKSRTAQFYHGINSSSYYYRGKVTNNGQNYTYTQAIDGDSCTTIQDYDNDDYDEYIITEGDLVHGLDIKNRRYNTLKSAKVTEFLFNPKDYADYNYPKTAENVVINGNDYFCETFDTVDNNGDTSGSVKYYFKGETLYAVEWYTGSIVTSILVMESYSETIPVEIYLTIPDNFTAGSFGTEVEVDPWED